MKFIGSEGSESGLVGIAVWSLGFGIDRPQYVALVYKGV